MVKEIIITGATGFLGQALLKVATNFWPEVTSFPIHSPRCGGIDLTKPDASEKLSATIHLSYPQDSILIHAATVADWNSRDGLLSNVAMALNVASWAKSVNIGFCVLVSGVNVYPILPQANVHTSCEPQNIYGLGKLTAELVWRLLLKSKDSAIVRLAGIWGWQQKPTLFWNQLLLMTTQNSPCASKLIVQRHRSRRNYISVREASECLLQIGANRLPGLFLGAGRDIVDTVTFIEALQKMWGSKLPVTWQDDGDIDEIIYQPSNELLPYLKPFSEELATIWQNKPNWVL